MVWICSKFEVTHELYICKDPSRLVFLVVLKAETIFSLVLFLFLGVYCSEGAENRVESCSKCKPANEMETIDEWCSGDCAPFPDTSKMSSCVLPNSESTIFNLRKNFQECRSKWKIYRIPIDS